MLRWMRTSKRFNSNPDRVAKDADCIMFFDSYWPQSSPPISGLSQLEVLRGIALDPSDAFDATAILDEYGGQP